MTNDLHRYSGPHRDSDLRRVPPPMLFWHSVGILLRNVAAGFAGGIVMWILALTIAAGTCLLLPSMAADAEVAWQAAWTPSGFLFVGVLMAAFMALLTFSAWYLRATRRGAAS